MRLACAVLGALVVLAMAGVALTLRTSSTGVVAFGPVDQFAIAGLGVVLAWGVVWLGRSRVDADAAGVRIRNLAVTRELPWQAVRAVRFDAKSPWASLLLENGDEMSVLAIQAIDKEYAVRAVEKLRLLHRAARANDPKPPPLLYDT